MNMDPFKTEIGTGFSKKVATGVSTHVHDKARTELAIRSGQDVRTGDLALYDDEFHADERKASFIPGENKIGILNYGTQTSHNDTKSRMDVLSSSSTNILSGNFEHMKKQHENVEYKHTVKIKEKYPALTVADPDEIPVTVVLNNKVKFLPSGTIKDVAQNSHSRNKRNGKYANSELLNENKSEENEVYSSEIGAIDLEGVEHDDVDDVAEEDVS